MCTLLLFRGRDSIFYFYRHVRFGRLCVRRFDFVYFGYWCCYYIVIIPFDIVSSKYNAPQINKSVFHFIEWMNVPLHTTRLVYMCACMRVCVRAANKTGQKKKKGKEEFVERYAVGSVAGCFSSGHTRTAPISIRTISIPVWFCCYFENIFIIFHFSSFSFKFSFPIQRVCVSCYGVVGSVRFGSVQLHHVFNFRYVFIDFFSSQFFRFYIVIAWQKTLNYKYGARDDGEKGAWVWEKTKQNTTHNTTHKKP